MIRKSPPVAAFVLLLVLALATLGVGYGLWSKILFIQGTVNTGTVNAEFVDAFTDDDGVQDDVSKDFYDDGDCEIGDSSCDPKQTGAETQANLVHRYDKGVASCLADVGDLGPHAGQPGHQGATVTLDEAYPSYHCTAWFTIRNIGSIPVDLHSVSIEGQAAVPCATGTTPFNLGGNGDADVTICVSGLTQLPLQIDPDTWGEEIGEEDVTFDLDIHVLQEAPQDSTLEFDAEVCLRQWNEELGCPVDG